MGWAENLQNASFRGVQFEVLNTDEQISRDHAAYEYPFVDGADLHDLGRKARPFRMTAFLWGEYYEYKLEKLTAALDEGGDGELIHPVYGSVPSVIVTGYSIRHDAESPDSCTIDMSFLENRTGSALFSTPLPELFAQQLFEELDKLLAQLSELFDAVNRNRITTGADVPGNHSEHEERGGIRAGCRPAGSVTPPTADAETGAGGQLSAVAGVAVVR
ncbi:DNA circularization N-terminal domain-containing protein [Escherichia coli]|uniref:DNA circularization N-terminal domain-containing protein n=1 Tax=Escherichia coli TaxID=562 RepID=UPI001F47DBD8|nr:DNA circularization N-terminal domain-containing protein [Escherichia coli]